MDAITELKSMGYPKAEQLTDDQAELVILPSWGPENYYHDGEVTPAQAKTIWIQKLKDSGLTPLQIFHARNLFGI
jgi:hypothetical protein